MEDRRYLLGLVVPLAGTWIETLLFVVVLHFKRVVPLAGTWIETPCANWTPATSTPSFPLRERGLKPIYSYK